MPRMTARRTLAVVGVLSATALLAPSAAAASAEDGLWYYDATGLADVHQRTTGTGVSVALIDGRINPEAADLVGAPLTVHEPSYCSEEIDGPVAAAADTSEDARHATSMAALLIGTGTGTGGAPGVRGVAPGAAVTAFADRVNESCLPAADNSANAFEDAVASGADIVVVPGVIAFAGSVYADAIRAGVIVIGAGGNEGGPVTGVPATSNGAVATGTTAADGSLDAGSPTGEHLGVVAPGSRVRSMDPTFSFYGVTSGSSNSAVFTAGALALAMSAYPDATSNQILQALVRTTDGTVHEPTWDAQRGFGTVDVRTLVSVDPSTFPDENPFISDDPDATPTAEDLGAAVAQPEPDPTSVAPGADDATDEAATTDDGSILPVVLGVAGAVVLAGIVLSIVFLARRRRATSTTAQPQQHGGHHG